MLISAEFRQDIALQVTNRDSWGEQLVHVALHHIGEVVFPVDGDVLRPVEVGPHINELTIKVENLDAVVISVADIEPTILIYIKLVGQLELAGTVAVLTPCLEQLSLR